MYLVVSSSLNPASRSRVLAEEAFHRLQALTPEVVLVDLAEYCLPVCDGGACYDDAKVKRLAEMIQQARGILVATPIYNYDVNAAAKNLVELTGEAWEDKVVGFLCAAGGKVSYMAVMGLANSLMLDFRTFILPRFVFATGASFENGRLADPKVDERMAELVESLVRVSEALRK
jgi:FMN reductase